MVRLALILTVWCGYAVKSTATDAISFSRDVRPILAENCFHCHGPDPKHREADLRLDEPTGASRVITPKASAESELYRRLISSDPDLLMPPPSSHRKLTPAQITVLQQWIEQGAPWGTHWSFAPIQSQPVPEFQQGPSDPYPARNPIDVWVRAKQQQVSLHPSPRAARFTLLRRMSLDLTGLPPSSDEVERFEKDLRPDAYERQLHRYLASPEYGQRMAWDWLDAARYADSNGYQGDNERTMWPWRDWVVKAMNQNMPFDQFSIWQLAGDLIEEAPGEAKLATGFCRNHMINGEGGRIADENRVDYVMDMTETMGTVWLGLTLNCCRCHDHKYDPLTQQDYYQLYAYFNQTPVTGGERSGQSEPVFEVPTPEQTQAIESQAKKVREHRQRLTERQKTLASLQSEWEANELTRLSEVSSWQVLVPTQYRAEYQDLTLQPDQSLLASGQNPTHDTYVVTAPIPIKQVSAIRLDAIQDNSMTAGGLARSDSGNFVLTEIELQWRRKDNAELHPLKIGSAEATFEQGGFKIATAYDGNPKTGWAVYEGRKLDRSHTGVFRLAESLEVPEGSEIVVTLRHESPHAKHNLGRFRLSVSSAEDARLESESTALMASLSVPAKDRTEAQHNEILKAHRQSDAEHQSLENILKEAEKGLSELRKAVPKVMVMADRKELRETKILDRGLYNQPTEVLVSAKPPSHLPNPSPTDPGNRLSLARWLFATEQPLTARVSVNRLWQQLFGLGLVKTTEDFGVQGEFPLQIELLDDLAATYRDSGWDTKWLAREILTSHVYQQASHVSESVHQLDPENRYLARGARYRMPSWMLRDQALAVSGLLVRDFDGPGVNSYQPEGVWEEATFGNKKYTQDHGASLYRRSLYLFWRRIIAPTMFFDNASRQTCTVKALRTNTPLHALYT